MTRIFDALKKIHSTHGAAERAIEPPAPLPVPTPARGVRPVPARVSAPAEPIGAPYPIAVETAVPADMLREMTTLRVGLEAALIDRVPRAVMFVSSQAGEGSSTVALEFALTLAQDSRIRTVLVDAHARRPTFDGDAHGPARLRGGSEPGGSRHLDVWPLAEVHHGHKVIPPAALRDVFEAAASRYDWVVVDGPPVLEAPDGAPLSALADGVVVVVQAGRTKRPVLARAVELMRKAGARVMGSVLNRRRLEIPEFIYRRI
jgi:Mrp family chromosome partitioning ATPase